MRWTAGVILGLAINLLLTVLVIAQEPADTKILVKVEPLDGTPEPVKIIDESLAQGEDWLKGLTIEVENTSGKSINYLEYTLLVCDLRGFDYCVAIPLVYGKVVTRKVTLDEITEPAGRSKTEQKTDSSSIAPRGKIKLAVSESAYNDFKKLVEQHVPLSAVDKADLLIGQVLYADRSAWSNESLLSHTSVGVYKTGSNAYLIPKGAYVWGYLHSKDKIFANIYAGPAYYRDEKGRKVPVPGYNPKAGPNRSGGTIFIIDSGSSGSS